ncbi:hypothetical protein AB0G60_12395 [Streptomyces angustmyceticus]|uniref:Uncharacterized protein n=1 Tax=Streptomyces angustmyceticus TaxID=285578 RepID=A0A5J4LJP1_9ACTN|nr:hypothetical protein [Streptomyces angustmyceticus]UAL68305.1 hypothetical protein K7396_18720 [Streptomyces angustmyceticus]GES31769.1 hypothetical protein San01_42560 [Streptomyces angustmyceticus]
MGIEGPEDEGRYGIGTGRVTDVQVGIGASVVLGTGRGVDGIGTDSAGVPGRCWGPVESS